MTLPPLPPADGLILDPFAGPGGWTLGLHRLGHAHREVGIEWDAAACATRRAAGWATIRADVAAMPLGHLRGKVTGVILSPPCQLFSQAGKGLARLVIDLLAHGITDLLDGNDTREALREKVAAVIRPAIEADLAARAAKAKRPAPTATQVDDAARSAAYNACLVVEPARWVTELAPRWVVVEQVPAVLPLWQHFARGLRERGWSAWAAVLDAADFGVPQNRKRAGFGARRDGAICTPPLSSHEEHPTDDLFGTARAKWVSMAEALGWDGLVGFPRRAENGDDPTTLTEDGYRARDLFPTDGTAPTVTEKARSWTRREVVDTGNTRSGTRPDGLARSVDSPAPTITTRADQLRWKDPAYVELRTTSMSRPGDRSIPRGLDEPAPTLAFGNDPGGFRWHERRNDQSGQPPEDVDWPLHRPATSVMTRPLVADPGPNANRFNGSEKSRNDGIRVEEWEAAVLQDMPADYPWQGNRTKRFQQIGNLIPPGLSAAILTTVLATANPSA